MAIFRDKIYDCFECLLCNTKQFAQRQCISTPSVPHIAVTKSIEEFSTNAFLCPKATKSLYYIHMYRDSKGQSIYNRRSIRYSSISATKSAWTLPFHLGRKFSFPHIHTRVRFSKDFFCQPRWVSLQKASASVFSMATCAQL